MYTTATIIRKNNRLSVGWSFGGSSDNSGDYPATPAGLADLKADLKADGWSTASDFAGIDALALPHADGHGDRVELTGD